MSSILPTVVDFFSTGSTLSSSKIFSFLLWSNKLYPAVRLAISISVVFILLMPLCCSVGISKQYKNDG
jgi:hypothetical protein